MKSSCQLFQTQKNAFDVDWQKRNFIYSGSQKSEVCPMPYALCPMPYAHEYLIFRSKGYIDREPLYQYFFGYL